MSTNADNKNEKKKLWTDDERLELANKLDAELDEFINSLERKRYNEGWPEDKWQEEMEKHPFFMKKAPQPGDYVHPMFEGLQKLKYDPTENTKEELALNYKDDGNFYMKHKKFRMAICSFTEGIQVNCDNMNIQAILYNNRSAAHFFLKNYRSALLDAQTALKYQPNYYKPKWRAAQCAYYLNKFLICSNICKDLLEENINGTINRKKIEDLLKRSTLKQLEIERNLRKEEHKNLKRLQKFQNLCNALKSRQVKFYEMESTNNGDLRISEELIQPKFLPLENFPVHFDDNSDNHNNVLMWPAAFSYPEFSYSDFQQQLSEEARMLDALKVLLFEPLPHDKCNNYNINSVNVYYENPKLTKVIKVDLQQSIKAIIQEEEFYVIGGSLLFYIVPKGSQVEIEFLHATRRSIIYNLLLLSVMNGFYILQHF